MSASQRVQILATKSEELNVLAEFIRNPGLIDELSAEILKLNALTEHEENKVKDARDLLAKSDALQVDLQAQRDDIKVKRNELSSAQELFKTDIQRVTDTDAALKVKVQEQAEVDKRHEKERAELAAQRAAHASAVSDHNTLAASHLDKVEAARRKNEAKAEELKALEQSLKAKAEAIKGLVG